MKRKRIISIAIAVLTTAIFFQCSPSNEDFNYPATHYDVLSIINQQIELLDSLSPTLEKTVIFTDDSSTVSKSDIDWSEELELFKAMDINKPALAPLYDSLVNESLVYRLKKADYNSKIKELKVKPSNAYFPKMISATIIEDNYLYASEKKLMLYFDQKRERLESYHIDSKTKVILKSEERGEILAKLIY